MKKSIHTDQAPQPVGCYSQALLTGNFLFVSGQIAITPTTGELVGPDIKEQTIQVMENTKAILTEAGMTLNDVVKSTLYLADIDHFAAVNEIYGRYFADPAPTRETIEAPRLPKDSGIELSVIAYKAH
jgi:2-iminobutanoate/2-iminopropanoate deaminase